MRLLLCLPLLTGCLSVPEPEEGWVQIAERGGDTLSALGLEGKRLPRLRGEGVIAGDALEVIAVIADVARSAEWVPHMVEARHLEPPSNEATWVYQRGRAPIPANVIVWDRDVVMHTTLMITERGQAWRAEFEARAPERVPVPERVVRMPRLSGHAEVSRTEDGRALVVFEIEADAGGQVPESVKLFVIQELPFEMLSALRKRVERKGQDYAGLVDRWRADGVDLSVIGSL